MRYSSLLLFGSGSIALARVAPLHPLITPAPSVEDIELRARQDSRMDLASLAQVLLSGVPPSLLDLALTNVPAVSKILWSEFLDDNTPSWFTALPTDVQAYLSGQFGPTTASSNSASSTSSSSRASATSSTPSVSQTAANNQVDSSNQDHDSGLPLWAKVAIGLLVPLIVIGLIALVVLCCLRRRRRHRRAAARTQSRTPTPAFISSSHRANAPIVQEHQHPALRGGYLSSTNSTHHNSDPIPQESSGSEDFRTPIGGPSYEELPATTGVQNLRRSSRQSSSSLHSVPEIPEPTQQPHGLPIPFPPRSPRRSRDFSQDIAPRRVSSLNPLPDGYVGNGLLPENPYYAQGLYAGSRNPYAGFADNPFTDHASPYQTGHSTRYSGSTRQEEELFLPNHGDHSSNVGQAHESNWPLRAVADSGYRTPGRSQPHEVYEKVYEM